MSLDAALQSELAPLVAKITELQGANQVLENDLTSLALRVSENARAISEILGAEPPHEPPDDPGEEPDPGPVPGAPNGVIGMNSGFVGRHDNPDNPDLPGYADKLRPVCRCYRPMNHSRINDDTTEYDTIDYTHKYAGMTWRQLLAKQVAVSNSVNADFYWNGPIAASAQFYRQASRLIREELNPDSKQYVAWGNENWNGSMGTYKWLKEQSGSDPGSGDNPFLNLWGQRLSLFFGACRAGDPSCIRVVETKTARDGEWFTYEITQRLTTDFDAVAGTLYFGPHYSGGYWDGISVDKMMQEARKEWENDDKRWQEANIAWAKDRGKLAIAYEAGQHFQKYGFEATTRACQTHPDMPRLYRDVYGNAIAKGIDLIIDFDFLDWDNEHGHFGKADRLDRLESSLKYQVVKEIASA